MDEVFIDMRYQNDWIKKYFNADFVSIEQLISCIEDLDGEIEELKDELKKIKNPEEPDEYDIWNDKRMMYEEV